MRGACPFARARLRVPVLQPAEHRGRLLDLNRYARVSNPARGYIHVHVNQFAVRHEGNGHG